MARIYKRGKVWYLDIQANGTRIRRRIGTRKKVAELALQDAVVKNERQEFGFARKDATIQKFIEQFLEYSKANHRPSTVRRYTAVCDHFLEFIKAKRNDIGFISLVTPEVMDQYKVFRKEEWTNPNGAEVNGEEDVREYTRKGARAHTINFEISALRTVFNLAIKWGYLRDNPTKEIKKLKVDDAKPVRFLTKKECQRLLDASPEHLYPIFYTFLHTGMRKQELENLEWSDIDLRRNRIQIKRKANWNPKTGERDIPISQPLHELLKSLKDNRGDESYVFPDKSGGKSRMKLREQLIRVAKKAEIDDLTKLHTLRHTFASHLVMSGVDLPTVQKLMGHADIQTTMIYAHLAPDHLAEAVNKVSF